MYYTINVVPGFRSDSSLYIYIYIHTHTHTLTCTHVHTHIYKHKHTAYDRLNVFTLTPEGPYTGDKPGPDATTSGAIYFGELC